MINHPRVLVVDDSPTTCLFVASTLEQAGFEVEIALKGREGLARIMRYQPYCLVLDVMLPDMSGYAVCRQVQQSMLKNSIYIILISAKNAPLDQRYGLSQGANRYLPKPFTAGELVQAVWEGVPEPLRRIVPSTLAATPQADAPPALSELLPRRVSNRGAMRTNSPFARTPAIKDDQASRLYSAIDGKKTLADLVAMTGLEAKAVTAATRVLIKEKYIQLYDVAGQPVEKTL
ncbi:MAG TPA: response regulator [Ktedonobacteraceae bacterium]|nr:response regulator [Ktedonobacteraceae bacterium]